VKHSFLYLFAVLLAFGCGVKVPDVTASCSSGNCSNDAGALAGGAGATGNTGNSAGDGSGTTGTGTTAPSGGTTGTAPTGTTGSTPAPTGTTTSSPATVDFVIPDGTGTNPWNTAGTAVMVHVGDTLNIHNMDSSSGHPHELHADGKPCNHGSGTIPVGGMYTCKVAAGYNPNVDPLYDHTVGTSAKFNLVVEP